MNIEPGKPKGYDHAEMVFLIFVILLVLGLSAILGTCIPQYAQMR